MTKDDEAVLAEIDATLARIETRQAALAERLDAFEAALKALRQDQERDAAALAALRQRGQPERTDP